MRLQLFLSLSLSLSLILATASPVHQLDDPMDDITAALLSPSPSPTPSTIISPIPTISITPTANPSQPSEPSLTPFPSTTPQPDELPAPLPSPTVSTPPSITPSPADELLPPVEGGFGDIDDDEEEGDAFGVAPDQVTEQASPKTAESGLAAAPSSISALALVGIAVAILAPAVTIFWFVRRRSAATGFENMPRVETDTYRGSPRDTFTVA